MTDKRPSTGNPILDGFIEEAGNRFRRFVAEVNKSFSDNPWGAATAGPKAKAAPKVETKRLKIEGVGWTYINAANGERVFISNAEGERLMDVIPGIEKVYTFSELVTDGG